MKDYIITVIGVSVFCGLIEMLSPNEEGFKKHIKLIASLCVLCVVAAPIGNVIEIIKDYDLEAEMDVFEQEALKDKYYDIYVANLGEYTSESIAEGAKTLLADEFDMESDSFDVFVCVNTSDEDINIERVSVVLYSKAIFKDPHKISEYVSNLLKCECEIIYK